MSGTVNISRDIWHDAAFKAEPFTEREAWVWLVMEARYKPGERRVGSVAVSLDRGQLAGSVRFMAEAWGWTKSRVDRFLKRLENRDMIGTASGTGLNVITICKYDEYQNPAEKSGQPQKAKRDSSGTAAGQQRDKPNKGVIQGEEGDDSFDQFWSAVPRKVGKGGARKAYARALKKTDSATLFSAMKAYAAIRAGQDETYTKHPATWLNDECWADAPPQLTPINGGQHDTPNQTERLQRTITAAAEGTSGKDWG